jgi:hypothetical protein
LSNKTIHPIIEIENAINYYIDGTEPDRGFLRGDENWEAIMASNQTNIRAGEISFYRDPRGTNLPWTHAAIITGWDVETNGAIDISTAKKH